MSTNRSLAVVGLAMLACGTPEVRAATLVEFSFENFAVGQVSGGASAMVSGMSATHNMANNGVENLGAPNFKLSMTRFAGSTNYPQLTFTNTATVVLGAITFDHIHNHNPGYPTFPNYDVDLEIDMGSGFTVLGTFLATSGGYYSEAVTGPGLLVPGTYSLRWIPRVSPDTSSEFFGLDNIRLDGEPLGCDPCAAWSNHGAYVSCVAQYVNDALKSGLVSRAQVAGVVSSAARSDVGKPGYVPVGCP